MAEKYIDGQLVFDFDGFDDEYGVAAKARSCMIQKGILDAPDPSALSGWKIGDTFGILRTKGDPRSSSFWRLISSCPEGIIVFGKRRTVYAIESIARPEYEQESIRALAMFADENILMVYEPDTKHHCITRVDKTDSYLEYARRKGLDEFIQFLENLQM